MSYKVEEVNGCTKKLVFDFSEIDLSSEIKTALVKKQKETNLKGFRKGKAPLEMIQKLYGLQVENDALNQFVQAKFFEAITKEDLRMVGYPSIENLDYKPGQTVKFEATVEIFPTVEVKDMSKYSFKKDVAVVTEDDIENIKRNYLSSKAEMVEITDDATPLKKGHFAVMNFQGIKEDGERPENMKGEEFLLEIGSGQFIPGFEEKMEGMKKGEKKNIDLTFPETYHVNELKDAKVTFEVELLEIKEKNYPEFTDELAKEFGYESMDDFNTKNRDNLTYQKERQAKEKLNQEILEKLVKENSFEIPKTMVHQQANHLREDITRNLKQQGFDDKMVEDYFEKWSDDLNSKADFQVRSGLILDKLAKDFEVETSEEDLNVKIEEIAKHSGMDPEQIKSYYTSNEQIKQNLRYAIREEKTFEKILEKVKLT